MRLSALKKFLSNRPEVAFAFAFGSVARGEERSESDLDLAIYLETPNGELQMEEAQEYETEENIWNKAEKITKSSVDLVVLNRASAPLAWQILREGQVLVLKNYGLYLKFLLAVSTQAEDFLNFTEDFYRIKARSHSLNEIDRARLIRIADFLESELGDHARFASLTQQLYETEADLRRNLEHWAENIVNASIDIAKIILAAEKKKIPATYREALEDLKQFKKINPATAQTLADFTKLRNILAHQYLDLRFHHLQKFLRSAPEAYGELLAFVKNILSQPV